MKKIIFDCGTISSIADFHEQAARKFEFPDYYGRNLDALYDLLTELPAVEIVIENANALRESIPCYADLILMVFREAAVYNKNIVLHIL